MLENPQKEFITKFNHFDLFKPLNSNIDLYLVGQSSQDLLALVNKSNHYIYDSYIIWFEFNLLNH